MYKGLIATAHTTMLTHCHDCKRAIIMNEYQPGDLMPRLAPFRKLTCRHCHKEEMYWKREMVVKEFQANHDAGQQKN